MEDRRQLPGYRPPTARPYATIQLLRAQVAHRSHGKAGLHRKTTDPVRSDSTTAIVARLASTISASGTGGPVLSRTAATKALSSPTCPLSWFNLLDWRRTLPFATISSSRKLSRVATVPPA